MFLFYLFSIFIATCKYEVILFCSIYSFCLAEMYNNTRTFNIEIVVREGHTPALSEINKYIKYDRNMIEICVLKLIKSYRLTHNFRQSVNK